jgi:type I restriction enzyme S subunit
MSAVMENRGIPGTWELVPLKDLGQWSGGGTPSKAKPEYWEKGKIPWVSPKDMKTERIVDSEDHITKAAVEESTAKLISAGSVLIVTRSGILSHTLPVAVTTVPVTVNQDLKALTPKEGVLPEYVAWALRSFARDILNTCSKQGTTVNSIETAALHRFEIPVAPLDQQKHIVAEIEKQFSCLDEAVANLKRVKANLKRYKAAVLKAAVEGRLVADGVTMGKSEWERKPIGVAVESLDQGWSPQCENEPAQNDDDWAVMKTTAVQSLQFLDAENKRLPVKLEPRAHLELIPGDLLITRAGPRSRVGVACLVKATRPRIMLCDKVYRLRTKQDVALPAYLELVLNSPDVVEAINELKTGISDSGVNLTQKRFQELLIPIPPVSEQKRMLAEVDRRLSLIRETETQVDAILIRSERLRQAILRQAFSGQLFPSEWGENWLNPLKKTRITRLVG